MWPSRARETFGNSEPRFLTHGLGDYSVNHWHTAEGLDVTPPGERNEPPAGHDPDVDSVYVCGVCGHSAASEPCIIVGSEVLPMCPDCRGVETFKLEHHSIWED